MARIKECLSKLREFWDGTQVQVRVLADERDVHLVQHFTDALDDDLNISKAWGTIFEWVRELNRSISQGTLSGERAASALGTWKRLDQVLGMHLEPKSPVRMSEQPGKVSSGFLVDVAGEQEAPAEIRLLLMERMQARLAKDFKRSDAIRDELKAKGWMIEDTPKGPRLKEL